MTWVVLLLAAVCSGAGLRGGGGQPDDMKRLLKDLGDQAVPVRSVCFTTDGGWVVAFEGGLRGGGRQPDDMKRLLKDLGDQAVPVRSAFFTTDGGWVVTFD